MHVRTQIRHRIVSLLTDVPGVKFHKDTPLNVDKGMMFDEETQKFKQHGFVTSYQTRPLGDDRKSLGGCCCEPMEYAFEVSLFVASKLEGYEQFLDDIEASVWPRLAEFQNPIDSNDTTDWPELIFTQEITQPSSPETEFPAFVRSLQFTCELEFNKVSPHEMNRLT